MPTPPVPFPSVPTPVASRSQSRLSRTARQLSAALLLSTAISAGALAQSEPPAEAKLLRDFIHYVAIDNRDMAASAAKALLDKGMKPSDFANLVESTGVGGAFEKQAIRGQQAPELMEVSGALMRAYEQGKLDQARNAAEISKNIGLLTGTQRNRMVATDRLVKAGEYAMPQLFQALIQRGDPARQAEVRRVLVSMSNQAVMPLCTALVGLEPVNQEVVIGVLGEINYPASLPFLSEVRSKTQSDQVRSACDRAIRTIAAGGAMNGSTSALYTELAEGYYNESLSLTSFPGEPQQLLWAYDPGLGLLPTAIDSAVYHEAMAMRMCERALMSDSQNGEALSLWLASNFKREIESPKEYQNPTYPGTRPDAMYYAVAAGPVSTQRVLGRAIDTRNTQLARRAIAAIERTAGASAGEGGLWDGRGRNPLLESLRYPNRRVQYEAAMAVGNAGPRTGFDGSDRVVPILASAVRDASARFAVVIAAGTGGEKEMQTALADALRAKGYEVLPPAASFGEAMPAIAEKPGIDLIVLQMPSKTTDNTIAEIRGNSKTAATPVLALVDLQGIQDLGGKYQRDPSVRLGRNGLTKDQIGAASDQLVEVAVGGAITADEARGYKERSLSVLRDLAVSGNPTLNVADAASPLINALPANRGPMKQQIGEVLSFVPTKTAQVALLDDAMTSTGDDRVGMLGKAAASAKRFGNQLESRQVGRVVEMAMKGAGEEATAAAALMGALNLPNDQLIPLIIGKPAAPATNRASNADAAR